jgi:hypothetical protein
VKRSGGAALAFLATIALSASSARAQAVQAADATGGPPPPAPIPPPLDTPYVQYGVALTTETVANAGKMCASSGVPCILGSGGGVVARLGRRSAGPWYFGAAYELSKQDPANLYRFATLQQARAEARWYYSTPFDTYPYVTASSGAAAYGDEWAIDTYGPIESIGIGVESQVSRRIVVGLALSYRALLLKDFVDSSGDVRGTSFVQMVGIELSLEERSPVTTSLAGQ